MRKRYSYEISPALISVDVGNIISINRLMEFEGAFYEPDIFPSVDFYDEQSGMTFKVFQSGKITCQGGKGSKEEALICLQNFLSKLVRNKVIPSTEAKIEVKNFNAKIELKRRINLWKAHYLLEESRYNPEEVPWLMCRMPESKIVFHLNENGKIYCTGGKNEKEVVKNIEMLVTKLEDLKILK